MLSVPAALPFRGGLGTLEHVQRAAQPQVQFGADPGPCEAVGAARLSAAQPFAGLAGLDGEIDGDPRIVRSVAINLEGQQAIALIQPVAIGFSGVGIRFPHPALARRHGSLRWPADCHGFTLS